MRQQRMIYQCLFIGLLCGVSGVFADSYANMFTPDASDLSLSYLRMIFGSVGTALHGTDNVIVAKIFEIFNIGVLSIVGGLIGYSVIMAAVSTSQDAQQAFQSKVSPWAVFRVAIGSGMLIPTFNGYSGIQVLVMTVVVQGVGFANYLWTSAITALDTPNTIVVATEDRSPVQRILAVLDDKNNDSPMTFAKQLVKANMCTIIMSDVYRDWKKLNPTCFGSATDQIGVGTNAEAFGIIYNKSGKNPFSGDQVHFGATGKQFSTKDGCNAGDFYTFASNIIQSNDSTSSFTKVEDDYFTTLCGSFTVPQKLKKSSVAQTYYSTLNSDVYRYLMSLRRYDASKTTYYAINSGLLDTIVADLDHEIMNPTPASAPEEKKPWIDLASSEGWVMAGMHYKDLVSQSKKNVSKVFL